MSSINISIAGFTGRMSQFITDELLKRPGVTIHGIVRSIEKVKPKYKDSRIKLFEGTDSSTLRKAVSGTEVCICCYLGDDEFMTAGQKLLIDACVAEGVERYIAADWCLDYTKLGYGDIPNKDPMKHVADYLDTQPIQPVHILTGAFMEVLYANFFGLKDANHNFGYYGTGDEPYDITSMPDIAAYTAEIALDRSAAGWLRVAGDRKTPKELAEAWNDVFGVKSNVQHRGSLADLYTSMTTASKRDPQNLFAWIGQYYRYYMAQEKTRLSHLDNSRYPSVKPTTLEQYLKQNTPESAQSGYAG